MREEMTRLELGIGVGEGGSLRFLTILRQLRPIAKR